MGKVGGWAGGWGGSVWGGWVGLNGWVGWVGRGWGGWVCGWAGSVLLASVQAMHHTCVLWACTVYPSCCPPASQVCAHNTDGIDVHGSPAWIHRCSISTGDDNVAMHANDTLVEDNGAVLSLAVQGGAVLFGARCGAVRCVRCGAVRNFPRTGATSGFAGAWPLPPGHNVQCVYFLCPCNVRPVACDLNPAI